MRSYIFTEWDKGIIRRYIEEGIRLEGFGVLKKRINDAYPDLIKDMVLLEKFRALLEE